MRVKKRVTRLLSFLSCNDNFFVIPYSQAKGDRTMNAVTEFHQDAEKIRQGWSAQRAVTGQSAEMVAYYRKKASRKRLSKAAQERRDQNKNRT
jgi:hypothetical protein